MKLLNKIPPMGKKGTVAGLVVCFVSMIALAGMYTFSQYEGSTEEQSSEIAELEQDLLENAEDNLLDGIEQAESGDTGSLVDSSQEANTNNIVNSTEEIVAEELEIVEESLVVEQEDSIQSGNDSIYAALYFDEGETLTWPVNGGVIMKYNMDETVYFETLDQYKRNSAMIIDGEVGDAVVAAAEGVVLSIEVDTESGQTVTMDIGNGYELVYGQLEGLDVSVGSYVEAGTAIGILAEPTKYYSLEGCNLYFQLWKDGETVDPLEYLE